MTLMAEKYIFLDNFRREQSFFGKIEGYPFGFCAKI
jgi:hypothetical protein